MSKRRLMVEVDCGGKRCKRCEHVDHGLGYGARCDAFDKPIYHDERGKYERHDSCLAAERDAAPLVDEETLDAWDVLAREVCAIGIPGSLTSRCGNTLVQAVAVLRRQHEPATVGGFVEAPTPERIPVVLWGQGKVKP